MISYNDLYEILRKEKYSEVLQTLPNGFLKDYAEYLASVKETAAKEEGSLMDSLGKSKKQLENSISLFRELILRRKKKLLNLVFVAAETGIMKRDYENMMQSERDVFEKLVKAFEDSDKEISAVVAGKINKEAQKHRMIMFNQPVEQFVDMLGNTVGPFSAGELANLESEVSQILVTSGKAGFVDEG